MADQAPILTPEQVMQEASRRTPEVVVTGLQPGPPPDPAATAGEPASEADKGSDAEGEEQAALDPRAADATRKVKVKIDGVESDVTLAELTRSYQKSALVDRRLSEATSLRDNARTIIEAAKSDPMGLIREVIGEERLLEAAVSMLEQRQRRAKMTPEERQREQDASRAHQLERELAEERAQSAERETQMLQSQYQRAFEAALSQAGVSPDAMGDAVSLLAMHVSRAREQGQVSKTAFAEMVKTIAGRFGGAPKAPADRARGRRIPPAPATAVAPAPRTEARVVRSPDEVRAEIARMFGS